LKDIFNELENEIIQALNNKNATPLKEKN